MRKDPILCIKIVHSNRVNHEKKFINYYWFLSGDEAGFCGVCVAELSQVIWNRTAIIKSGQNISLPSLLVIRLL